MTSNGPSHVGVIRYPGSNCDFDALDYFSAFGKTRFIWHTETELPDGLSLLVIPGGFAFGDRMYDKATGSFTISPGTKACESPVTAVILEAYKRKIPIIGICNGFQILIHLGLLPGELLLNNRGNFVSKKVNVSCTTSTGSCDLYVANSYGRYVCPELPESQVFVRYSSDFPDIGAQDNIAGVCDATGLVYGMMPHPERQTDTSDVFRDYLLGLLSGSDEPTPSQQQLFHDKIQELMHSEHVSYKSTRKYLKHMHTKEPWVIQGPGENAGLVDIGDGYAVAIRIESHNHPTYIDPHEGAATGVGGILRDIFTMGARPIAIMDFLRFGVDDHSKELLHGAIGGISYYGNCVGVPNIGGDLWTDPSYNKNPLVNVACLGLVRQEDIIYGYARKPKQLLIYVGSRTGNEGIGGAAMASKSFSDNVHVDSMKSNVQKSDPFLEKLLLEACCEIAEHHLAAGMQDMGASGLLCASHELAKRGADMTGLPLGARLDLAKVPTKYEMEPHNILISESQERMLLVAEPENVDRINAIFQHWDLESAVVGEITEDGRYSVYLGDELLYTETIQSNSDIVQHWDLTPPVNRTGTKVHDPELWTVYDSTVGNRTVKGPDQNGSYAVLNIKENNTELCLTWGDFDECREMLGELKAKPLCIVNCLNYGHPKDSLGSLVSTVQQLTHKCERYNIPVVGGNVSLYNSTDDQSIIPTPVIVMLGSRVARGGRAGE